MSRFSKNSLDRLAKRRALLDTVLAEEGLQSSTTQRITHKELTGPVPMSFGQQRLWVIDRLMPGSPTYNTPVPLRLKGTLNVAALNQSITEIVRRHDALRTTFLEIDGEPYQLVHPAGPLPLPVIDISTLPEDEREAEATRLTNEDGRYSFDLEQGPLFRATLLRLGETDHILLLNRHHIISDAWSTGIMLQELVTLYKAYSAGEPSPLPELPVQYTDYSLWQRDWMQGEVMEKQLAYWKEKLAGLPVLELPTDRPRPPLLTFEGANEAHTIPKAIQDQLNALSLAEGATLFMTMTAVYATLLYRYSGQDDVAIGIPISGRNQDEIANVMGFFVNSLVLRIDLSGKPTFRELLRRVRDTTLEAYANQDLPFEKLVETLPQRDPSRMPLNQVVFILQNVAPPLEMPGIIVSDFPIENNTAKFDLSLFVDERPNELAAIVEYNTDLFDASTMSRLLGHLHVLSQNIAANPDTRINDLPLMTEAEQAQLLHPTFNPWQTDTSKLPTDSTIQAIFEGQAARRPETVAVIYPATKVSNAEETSLTYDQLNRRANQLAHYLRAQGVGPDSIVGIHVERSLEMVVALLGVLKAGAAYLPLNPANPPDRLAFMLEDAQIGVRLTLDRLASGLPEYTGLTLRLDADWGLVADQPEDNLPPLTTNQNRAMVIYTSGSTGRPKGVVLNQSGYLNLFSWYRSICEMDETSRVLLMMSFSYDAALKDIATPLLVGGQLVLAPSDDPEEIIDIIDQYQITISGSTASQLYGLPEGAAENEYRQLSSLVYFSVGGEPTDVARIRAWFNHPNCHCRLIHVYGPTECSDLSTTYGPLGAAELNALDKLPIGYPLTNMQVHILDPDGQLQPVGVLGELCVSGAGLARGYLDRPALTAERFVANPFEEGQRLYKTGDLARWRADGALELMGRIDHQVKIRGLRIELREIELVLLQHAAVRECVVEVREDRPGDKRLVAYVVTTEPAPTIGELRGFVQQKLPEYMVPSFIMILEALPISPNGKVDRKALPAPDDARPELSESFVAPRDTLELQLAQIWETVLNVRPIGIIDNFFALGGHSLLAMRLMSQIQKQFNQKLPLSVLFQAGTIDQIAALLRQQNTNVPHSPLVPIQPNGTKRPFFCVHAVGGHVLSYMELAQQLGPDQPFYGLQAPGVDGDDRQYSSLEEMATHYLEAIRTVQPDGPYLLGGWSLGGVVAYEMAQQLQRQGQEVELLALIDSYTPLDDIGAETFTDDSLVSAFAGDLKGVFNLPITDDELLALPPEAQLQQVVDVAKQTNALPADTDMQQIQQLLGVFKTNALLLQGYQPLVYPKQVLLLRAGEQPADGAADPVGSWRALAAEGVELHTIPGNHYTIIRRPNVRELAQRLAEHIGSVPDTASAD